MRTTNNKTYSTISTATLAELTSIVSETIAVQGVCNISTFTAAELWCIQQRARVRRTRRMI